MQQAAIKTHPIIISYNSVVKKKYVHSSSVLVHVVVKWEPEVVSVCVYVCLSDLLLGQVDHHDPQVHVILVVRS